VPVCENFLYGFKAARGAARAAASAASSGTPLGLRAGRGPTPVGWREKIETGRLKLGSFIGAGRASPLPLRNCPRPVRTRQARLWPQGNRTRILPGERTREDGLDRTCPAKELAAIGSRDTCGQGPLTLERQPRIVSIRRG